MNGDFETAEGTIRSISQTLRVNLGSSSLHDEYVRFHLAMVRGLHLECDSVNDLDAMTMRGLSHTLESAQKRYMSMGPEERGGMKLDQINLQFERTAGSFYAISYLRLTYQTLMDSGLPDYKRIRVIQEALDGIQIRRGARKFDFNNGSQLAMSSTDICANLMGSSSSSSSSSSSEEFHHDLFREVDCGDGLLGMPQLQDLIETSDMEFLQNRWESLLWRSPFLRSTLVWQRRGRLLISRATPH